MNKPVILSLGAVACTLLVLAVPAFNAMESDSVVVYNAASSDKVSGNYWQCVTQKGPDAPNLIVLRDNGGFLKLIDHSEESRNGTNYDLQGIYAIKQGRLHAHIRNASGEVFTDTYSVKHLAAGKMQMTRTVNNAESTDTENTRYSCNMLASRS